MKIKQTPDKISFRFGNHCALRNVDSALGLADVSKCITFVAEDLQAR